LGRHDGASRRAGVVPRGRDFRPAGRARVEAHGRIVASIV
jgi:hypothetical protein